MSSDLNVINIPMSNLFNSQNNLQETSMISKILKRISTDCSTWPTGYELKLVTNHTTELQGSKSPTFYHLGHNIIFKYELDLTDVTQRPPSEIAAKYLWSLPRYNRFKVENLLILSNMLGGAKALRTTASASSRYVSGHRFIYCDPAQIADRLEDLSFTYTVAKSSFSLKHCYMMILDFLSIHPLADGNGRLARLLFQGMVNAGTGLTLPVLPLYYPWAKYRHILMKGFVDVHLNHDATRFIDIMNTSVMELISLAKHSQYVIERD